MNFRRLLFSLTFLIFTLLLFTGITFSQTAPIQSYIQSYKLESGYFNGSGNSNADAQVVYTTIIDLQNIPWLSLHFSEANLGKKSYIIIRSLFDNHWQRLDAVSILQWNYFSAFFNRGEVEIKLYAHPSDEKIFFNIDEITVGEWAYETDSQCGPTDDRILSSQPATGRLLNVGCTAWIIPNGKFATAGHCLDGTNATIVQFQVPPSLPGGTIQHPGPEDQYSVNSTTKLFVNGGVGNDWGTFEVFPNSVTGLMPKQAQGAYWPLAQDLTPPNIRITGYGVDAGVTNQVQQTHVGPNASSSGTTMRYVTDTEGGNSGSPVIDEATGIAVGIHTHGGCTSSGGNNNGTSMFLAALWSAVEQGAGSCPVALPSNPAPGNGSTNISVNLSQLTWTNGAGAITNQLYFGTNPSSLTLVQSGTLATSWNVTGLPLNYSTTYYWRVVEVGDTCSSNGPAWSFTTQGDPNIVTIDLFCDNFDGTASSWTIFNDPGNTAGAGWQIENPPVGSYTIPSASGGVFAANIDRWGSGSLMPLSIATLIGPINFTTHPFQSIWMEWDNDWRILGAADQAHVELSTNGGTSWVSAWSKVGISVRNTHENVDIFSLVNGQSSVLFRLRVVQPGWDWWWAIDNFCIRGEYVIPVELTSFTAAANGNNVVLNWSTATETNNYGFEIQRKSGDDFVAVGFIDGYGTTTESKNYSYTDSKISGGKHVYRLKQMDFDGAYEYSNEVEVDIEVPKVFSLEQNYPNPFNPSTIIKYNLPVDSKVALRVFDVLGQEVMTLLNTSMSSGSHEITFDASNLNSGVYFYTLHAKGIDGNNFTSTKKMILTK